MSTAFINESSSHRKKSLYRTYAAMSGMQRTMGRFLTKIYGNIIAGTWAIMILLPVETCLDCAFGLCSGNVYKSRGYLAALVIFTGMFIGFFSVLPMINRHNVKNFLRKKMSDCVLTPNERKEAFEQIIKGAAYSNINTKSGSLRLAILILFNLTVASLFFGIENGIKGVNVFHEEGVLGVVNSLCMLSLSGAFYAGWYLLRKKYNSIYCNNYISRAENTVNQEIFSHLCDIATMNGIEGDGLSDLSIKESIENAINLSKVYYLKAQNPYKKQLISNSAANPTGNQG